MSKTSGTKERIINNRYLFYAFLAFMLGVIVSRRLYRGDIEIILVTIFVIVSIATLLFLNKKFIHIVLMLSLFFVGNGIYYLGSLSFNVRDYTTQVNIEARISDDIKEKAYGYEVLLKDVKVNGNKEKNVNLYIQNCRIRPEAGSLITYKGTLTKSKPFTLKSFNSSDYRSGARYNSSCNYGQITFREGYTKLDEKVRLAIKNKLFNHMSQDNAGVAYAVMFGDKNDLDSAIESTYKNAGIVHVLTVSGLHVGFLVALFYGLLKRCHANKYLRFTLTTIFIIFYAYLCGFTPSVMRAGIMSIVYMLSKNFERQYDSLTSLALAGFIICLIKPLSPLDIGFLMSFFCVFSIVTLSPVLIKFFSKFIPYKIAELISLSLSAEIGILPFLAYFGSVINLLSFVINLFIVPLFGVLYPYLFVVSMLSTFIPFVGYLLVIADYAFSLIYIIASFFEWSKLLLPISAYYFGLTILLFFIIFSLSGYVMLGTLKKFAFVFACSLIFFLSYGFYQIPIVKSSKIDYITSGSSFSLVLTNSKKESMVIGYNYNLYRYARAYRVNNLNTYISLDGLLSDSYINQLSSLGFSLYCGYQSMSEKENVKVISSYNWSELGDFKFRYASIDGDVVGFIVIMDGQCIFVVNNNNLSYNMLESVFYGNLKPDIVFSGLSEYEKLGEDYILVSINDTKDSDYSYAHDGNFRLQLKNGLWNIRGLD